MRFSNATLLLLALSAALNGCTLYKQSYQPINKDAAASIAARRVAPAPAQPAIERAEWSDKAAVLEAFTRRGYVMIGQSYFSSAAAVPEWAAVKQAVEVGADVVLVFTPQNAGSITSTAAITVPTRTTSTTTATATAFSPAGTTTAFGHATTTTTGTETAYIPYTEQAYDFGAVYYVKVKAGFGALFRDLSDAERQQIQSNRGAVVTSIVNDSPAFNADILPGDIVTAINGVAVSGASAAREATTTLARDTVAVALFRKDANVTKLVRMEP